MLGKIKETTTYLKSKGFSSPDTGIVLGTGLGGLISSMNIINKIAYSDIPNFPVSTVEGHEGFLIYGKFANKKIVAMKGRFHYYEGYSSEDIVFPVRVMKSLGIKQLFLSNAAGGLNPDFRVGDIMIIEDHINFLPNPLIGPNDNRIGPRFPDMSEAYDNSMIQKAEQVSVELNIDIKKGVYLATSGPAFETPAEYKHFRLIGADAVGMSTVPEVIAARHMNLPCFAISIISDLAIEGEIEYITHEMVTKAAAASESKMTLIMTALVNKT